MKEISLLSPAKLNLGLLVKEKREDGYHNIETIFVAINLFDRITISLKGRGIKIFADNPDIPQGRNNLIYRAVSLFYEKLGKRYGTEIFLENRIPPGRGLGGASSDAVTVLIGLNLLLEKKLKRRELFILAKELGSDCPFFLFGGACYARGRGEILEPIKIPKLKFFLYLPKIKISTSWAYSLIDRNLTKEISSLILLRKKLEKGKLIGIRSYLVNDFEKVVFRKYPRLSLIKEKIDRYTLGAQMTGSGSGLFGILERGKEEESLSNLRREKIRGIIVESLGRRLMGRTQDFGSLNGGSNPPAPAIILWR